MKCSCCEYLEEVWLDGFYCSCVDAFIPEELVDLDLDCMVYDSCGVCSFIRVDSDGCKNIGSELVEFKGVGC